MITAKQYGPWALIAGGSEGVGASFARKLAGLGFHLLLVARRSEPLEKLAQELDGSGVEVRTLATDLKRPDVLERIRGSRMLARGHGGIILVGSMSGTAGIPDQATYSASKAYTQIFAEALWCEIKPRGVDVLALVIGVVDTPARVRAGVPDAPGLPVLTGDDIAQEALNNLADGGPVYVSPSYAQMFQSMCSTPRRQMAEQVTAAVRALQKKPT